MVRSKVLALALLMMASAVSAQSNVVLSVMAQKQTLALDQRGSGTYAAVDDQERLSTDTGLGLGLAFGSPQGDLRVLLEAAGVGVQDVFSVDLYTLGVEKFFELNSVKALRPFVGVNAGFGKLDVDSGYSVGTQSGDDSGFIYGVSGGVQYVLTPTMALEARLRYLRTDLNAQLDGLPCSSIMFAVADARAVSDGVSFKF